MNARLCSNWGPVAGGQNRREELATVYKVLYPHLLVYALIGAETR